jgi:hypothetical protein
MTDVTFHTGAETDAAAAHPTQDVAATSRRRRLWQLPTQAHELLVALSFTPDWLRKEAARTLGQVHKGRCVLKGRDVDVLYSVVHDLTTRNPMAEAFQKHLELRHALAVRRLAKLHEPEALRAAWAEALEADDMPATLWALLTHPLGPELESTALYDARAWVFARARHGVAVALGQRDAESRAAQARQQAEELRSRLLAQQRQAAQAMSDLQAEVARLTGELASVQRPAVDPAKPAAPARCAVVRAVTVKPELKSDSPAPLVLPADLPARPKASPTASPKPASPPIEVQGRRVLCVGGIQHAVARYRGRIENLGGLFEHHDGGLEDSLQALEGRLSRADVVICQAACINHEAYHRVKRHCERTGKPCVYLDRPSLSRFDRALGEHVQHVASRNHTRASAHAISTAR